MHLKDTVLHRDLTENSNGKLHVTNRLCPRNFLFFIFEPVIRSRVDNNLLSLDGRLTSFLRVRVKEKHEYTEGQLV